MANKVNITHFIWIAVFHSDIEQESANLQNTTKIQRKEQVEKKTIFVQIPVKFINS